MRAKGITYDTGFVRAGVQTKHYFDRDTVARDLQTIKDDLHCTAVRVIGGDPGRLEFTAAQACRIGLEAWFSPYPLEESHETILALFTECAERAERLRQQGGEVVFVTGAELSLMNPGFVPGDTLMDRVQHMVQHRSGGSERVNEFLAEAVKRVRERFAGPVTYAAIPPDRVDWTPFDIVSLDLYRSAEIAGQYAEGIRNLVAQGKPVAITEIGAGTFKGAGDLGARGMEVVEWDEGGPVRLTAEYERDEAGQAQYLREVLTILDDGGVDSAFVFLYALHDFPHRPDGDPRDDLDRASYGIMKTFDDPARAWEPKQAFHALAEIYR